MSHFLQFTCIFTKSEISQVSCDNRIKTQKTQKKISLRVCDIVNHTMSVLMTTFQTAQTDFKSAALTSAPTMIFDWTKAQSCSLLSLVAASFIDLEPVPTPGS